MANHSVFFNLFLFLALEPGVLPMLGKSTTAELRALPQTTAL